MLQNIKLIVLCVIISKLSVAHSDNNYFVTEISPPYSKAPFPRGFRPTVGVDRKDYWRHNTINVCWETSGFRKDKELVRRAIAETWQAHSALNFTGWKLCGERGDIRIQIIDKQPYSILGRQIRNKRNGMQLNFQFHDWGEQCKSKKDYCIRGLAIHEFGHAIGLLHEQGHPDATLKCQSKHRPDHIEGQVLVTSYDEHSVMNYCNSKYNNDGELSELDIKAVAFMYPIKSECHEGFRLMPNLEIVGQTISRRNLLANQCPSECKKMSRCHGYTYIDGQCHLKFGYYFPFKFSTNSHSAVECR